MFYVVIFSIWLLVLIGFALKISRKSAWQIFFQTIILTIIGAYSAINMAIDGDIFNNYALKYTGQMLMVFVSVIGGSLMSLAFTELRKNNLKVN